MVGSKRIICTVWFLLMSISNSSGYSIIPDTLDYKNISRLKSKIYESLETGGDAKKYALKYQREVRSLQIPIKVAEAYYFLYLSSEEKHSIIYLDSLIEFSKTNQISKYLSIGFQEKGKLYFDSGNFIKALENYILALEQIDNDTRPNIYFIVSHNIAIIKDLIGQKREALEIYREIYNSFEEDSIKNADVNNYLANIFGLSHSFTENGKLDSATYYNRLGYQESIKYDIPKYRAKFILGEGYNLFYKMDYATSIDSIEKAIPLLKEYKDKFNLAIGYLYTAKNLAKLNSEYNEYLLSADSIISIENRYYPQFTELYELLYRNYKEEGNRSKQLQYLEKLINYDRELRDRYKTLYSTITREYDQPNLLREKEKIIAELEDSNRSWSNFFLIVSILLVASVFFAVHHYNRRRIYKKRFERLINQGGLQLTKTKFSPRSEINLSEEFVAKVLSKLDQFEKSDGFLNKEISLSHLAKSLDTNSNYLSRIINHKKGKNYSSYINDLRIEFVLKELLENKLLRKYTIRAIAHEIGFRNAESFSSAFFKRVGLYPSFYIRQLDKRG